MKDTVIPIVIGALGTVTKGLILGGLGNKKTNRDHPNYSIVEIGQNIENSPGDLRKFALNHTPENHQLTLV